MSDEPESPGHLEPATFGWTKSRAKIRAMVRQFSEIDGDHPMTDDRPGFYSLSHVDPADSVVVRRPGKPADEAQQIAEAIAFLTARGYRVEKRDKPDYVAAAYKFADDSRRDAERE